MRQKQWVIRGSCRLTGGCYALAYEAPDLLARNCEPLAGSGIDESRRLEGLDSIPLKNGGRLLRGSRPMMAYADGVTYNTSITRRLPDGPPKADEWVCINRAVLGIEEVGAVLVQVGAVMGLEGSDIHALVTTVAEKISHIA